MDNEVKLTIRVPRDVHERIQQTAAMSRRSLNSEIVYALTWWLTYERRNPSAIDLLSQDPRFTTQTPANG